MKRNIAKEIGLAGDCAQYDEYAKRISIDSRKRQALPDIRNELLETTLRTRFRRKGLSFLIFVFLRTNMKKSR